MLKSVEYARSSPRAIAISVDSSPTHVAWRDGFLKGCDLDRGVGRIVRARCNSKGLGISRRLEPKTLERRMGVPRCRFDGFPFLLAQEHTVGHRRMAACEDRRGFVALRRVNAL